MTLPILLAQRRRTFPLHFLLSYHFKPTVIRITSILIFKPLKRQIAIWNCHALPAVFDRLVFFPKPFHIVSS